MNDKQTLILDAAEDLFALHGFQESSTRAIATQAGVNPAMLSYYFGSKEQLLEMVLERGIARFEKVNKKAKLNHLSALQKLDAIMDQHIYLIKNHESFFRLLLHERFFPSSTGSAVAINFFLEKKYQLIKAIMTEAIAAQEMRLVDVELTSAILLGVFYNWAVLPKEFVIHSLGPPDVRIAKFYKSYLDELKIK
ncbi:TetR/AcrR family transcriptional regulator [Mucilaginibacter sp. cycad4]|uniref:TetR/AcrR family transcriptional regulator n=1 Tax=Mucilaginibacter sp. cycad4 TaxID=3342096 RepID=UPI002AABFBBB|nr:TetR/AcrR family transcriptional regulator [Mucilaginibacter gossypii]WPV01560.1 TetR/AcrR family transcriptional regulator [Mucilaginibacter gossypii]